MTSTTQAARTSTGAATAYSILLDLIALLVLLQGLLAGVFLQGDGKRDAHKSAISAHGTVADVLIVLALASAVVAFARLRSRRDLAIGSTVLTVLLGLEAYLGGAISEEHHDGLTVIHVPLAMAILALTVWLVVKGIALRRGNT